MEGERTVFQQIMEEVTTHARLRVWLASQRTHQHLLVNCPRGRFEAVSATVTSFAAGPVRRCVVPGALNLPLDRTGTLLLYDIAALQLNQQIALFDWLGPHPVRGDIRIVALTPEPMERLVEGGVFLEGLFHRLGSVQLHLACGPIRDRSASPMNHVKKVCETTSEEKAVCVDRMYVER
jgi:transcriptional regulator of acetoin/glycerol metabolism